MVHVLFEYPQLNCGGTEMVMFNLARFINKAEFQIDMLVQRPGSNEEQFRKLGCNIHQVSFESKSNYVASLMEFFKEHKYDVVHTHTHSLMATVLDCAKKAGVPVRVAHSHVARIDVPRILWSLQIFRNWKLEGSANLFFSCSKIAAEWLFPRHAKENHIIYNAIDLDSFKFNEGPRLVKRRELGVGENTKVVINVSRCAEGKNHHFIFDRAKALQGEDMLFICIGEGPLFNELQKRVDNEHITNVRMMGKRFDVPEWLCAADVFIFPSIYEGLGIVAVEAQASGLRVLSTDTIPVEADMEMGSFERISLSDTGRWEELLKEETYSPEKRKELSEMAFSTHYNIRVVAKQVEELYMSMLNGKE